MKSHDQLYDKSNIIGTISYHNSFRGWSFISYLSHDLLNLLDQLS